MSTIKTNTLTGTTSAGSIVVTGEGGSTTTNLQQGLAKVWCNINASSAVQDSFNIASITDHSGAGENNFNFTNAFGALTYVPNGMNSDDGTANRGVNVQGTWTGGNQTTSSVRMNTYSSADPSYFGMTGHGDLA
jgi:hypothetical protein